MNMDYCRFENTAKDIDDCLEHIDTPIEEMSMYELRGYKKFLTLMSSHAEECAEYLEELEEKLAGMDESQIIN